MGFTIRWNDDLCDQHSQNMDIAAPIDWRPESAEPIFIQESSVELLAFPYLFWNGKGKTYFYYMLSA